MTAWTDKVTERFYPEFSRLWIAVDPDELLLNPDVSIILADRGFEILSYRDPIAFRLEYESRIRDVKGQALAIIHFTSRDQRKLPWDLTRAARIERFSIAELFPTLDPTAVKSIGADKYGDLYQAVQTQRTDKPLGGHATKDFIAAYVYRVVPSLMRTGADFWAARFDLFFKNQDLPEIIAAYVAGVACLPDGMTISEAVGILTNRAIFLERVQHDWDQFATAVADGGEPPPGIIPFAISGIRTSFDSMVLDAAIKPTMVERVVPGLPSWMRIGIVEDDQAGVRLLSQQIEQLGLNIPAPGDGYRDWLAFGIRQGEVLSTFFSLPPTSAHSLRPSVDTIRERAEDAFVQWISSDFGNLSSNSSIKAPTLVHQVADHMRHRREGQSTRQALVVADGLAMDQWLILEQELKCRRGDVSIDTQACFAWLPTLTSVSRQSIFAGALPRTFESSIGTTSGEGRAWTRFWSEEGLAPRDIFYAKGLGQTGSTAGVITGPVAAGTPVIGLVVDTVDEMIHGANLGKAGIAVSLRHWLENGEWNALIDGLLDASYEVFITADHGNVEAAGIGRPQDGVAAETKGERSRVYTSEALRDDILLSIPGARSIKLGGLPPTWLPVFPPFAKAFIPDGATAVVHGGPSIEEVIVPFVRLTRKEKL